MKLSFAYISAFLVPILVNAANAVPTAAPTPAKSDITSLTLPRAARKGNSSSRTIRRVREMRQASFISSRKNLSVQNGVRDGAADHRLTLAIVRPIAAGDGEALIIDCSNDLDFRFEGNSSRTCDLYVAIKPVKRCEKIQPESGGKKVRKFCPGTCKRKCKLL